jgi:hypothetical protein
MSSSLWGGDHRAVRLAHGARRRIGEEVNALEPRPIAEMEPGDRIYRQAALPAGAQG